MSVPSIAKKVLQVRRGRHSASLETHRKISASVTYSPVVAGTVGYLNSSKEFQTGMPTTADKLQIPLITFQSSDDPDVGLPSSIDLSTESMGYASGVTYGLDANGNSVAKGPLMLVGLDAFVIESRHFESQASLGSNYAPGDALTATPADTNAVTGGRLTKGTPYTNVICGVVYDGVTEFTDGTSVLSWITYFLPRKS